MTRPATVVSFCLFAFCGTAAWGSAGTAAHDPAQLISEAKAAIAEVNAMGYEWRDTDKILGKAEKALAKGDKSTAAKLAARALRQANLAKQQHARYYVSAAPRF